ncbi:MAG: gfo/Idh/MocA family oxidoreductase [Rhizobiales bacterium]|nr:gfo/Idh/MocA family oxidoreductase [Hyphomicrobiales bacterium]
MSERKLRIGVAGLGRAFTIMLPTFVGDPRIELVAAADPRADARERFAAEFGGKGYATVEDLCSDANVEAVYVATPHQHHAENACAAAAHGKHVLVEKPMAIALSDCDAMIDAAQDAGVHLIVGHSHSFNAPIRRAREIIAGGTVGAVRMITAFNYTDFLYRPRRPEELDTARGGGVMFNQAAHQIDIVRLLGGGRVRSVRAMTGTWDPSRPTEGAYSALLTFEDGAAATAVYSGYAHFDSDEFCDWIGELGAPKDVSRYGVARKALQEARSPTQELAMRTARAYGHGFAQPEIGQRWHQHFGVVLVSCDHADLRPLPNGVMVYADTAKHLDPLPRPQVQRAEVIDELYDAVMHNRPPLHSGEWARATLEACLAILQSGREQHEIRLAHQVAVPA